MVRLPLEVEGQYINERAPHGCCASHALFSCRLARAGLVPESICYDVFAIKLKSLDKRSTRKGIIVLF